MVNVLNSLNGPIERHSPPQSPVEGVSYAVAHFVHARLMIKVEEFVLL